MHLVGDRAPLGVVLREIARQASISIVYPEAFESQEYTGSLTGPADALLDAIARRSELRFSLNNGVGYIGKPLPEDRSVGVLRSWMPDTDKLISPLLSEGGKVTTGGGFSFISDRSETVYRIISAFAQARPRIYCVQVLELFTSDTFDASLSITSGSNPDVFAIRTKDEGFFAEISASVKSSGAYLGRSWTGLITEGRVFKFSQGAAEKRTESVFQTSTPVIQNETFVSTGWHFDIEINSGAASGSIYQDATDQQQYSIPFQTSRPGLFLVNSAQLNTIDRQAGLPQSFARSGAFNRHLWLRYAIAGSLIDSPPPAAAH